MTDQCWKGILLLHPQKATLLWIVTLNFYTYAIPLAHHQKPPCVHLSLSSEQGLSRWCRKAFFHFSVGTLSEESAFIWTPALFLGQLSSVEFLFTEPISWQTRGCLSLQKSYGWGGRKRKVSGFWLRKASSYPCPCSSHPHCPRRHHDSWFWVCIGLCSFLIKTDKKSVLISTYIFMTIHSICKPCAHRNGKPVSKVCQYPY